MKRGAVAAVLLMWGMAALLPSVPGATAQDSPGLPLAEEFDRLEGGLPSGWTDASYGEIAVTYRSNTRTPQSGKACLLAEITGWDGGAMHLARPGITLRAGGSYAIEVWLRGKNLEQPVTVSLRKRSDPNVVYLSRRVAVDGDWQLYTVQGSVNLDDPDAAVTIFVPCSGTLEVDRLRVMAGEAPVEPDPPVLTAQPGNLIYNSSFELGVAGWAPGSRVAALPGKTPDGEAFAVCSGRGSIDSRPFVTRRGRRYTISAYLRAPAPGSRARLGLIELGGALREERTFELTSDWRRYGFSVILPGKESARYLARLGPDEGSSYQADAIQVEEGEAREYFRAAPVELSCSLPLVELFPKPDQLLRIPFRVSGIGEIPRDLTLHARMEGFYGERLLEAEAPIPPGSKVIDVPIEMRAPQAGTLRVVGEVVSGSRVIASEEVILTAVHPTSPKASPGSFFGAAGIAGGGPEPGAWHAAGVAAKVGARWWRMSGASEATQWPSVQPARESFAWRDAEVDALRQRGFTLLGVLGRTPTWAAPTAGEGVDTASLPPARTADFETYASKLADHYRTRISAYEVWETPWNRDSFAGTPEQYLSLVRAAAKGVRGAISGSRVIAGGYAATEPGFLDATLTRGIHRVVDSVSEYHPTSPDSVCFQFGGEDQVSQWFRTVRGRLDLAGGNSTGIWITSAGAPSPPHQQWYGGVEQSRAAARALGKSLTLARAAGVERIFLDPFWNDSLGFEGLMDRGWGLLDPEGGGKPTLAALATCVRFLEDVAPAGRVELPQLKAYVFQGKGFSTAVLWSPRAFARPVSLLVKTGPGGGGLWNLMGNPRAARLVPGHIEIPVRAEPLFLKLPGVRAPELLSSIKAAAAAQSAQSAVATGPTVAN